jgi:YihY family inner membrane protein
MKHLLTKLDRFQQRHRFTAFAYGVIKKYGQDRGGNLAALITYYGFLSLFPLLLLFYTVSSYVLPHFPGSQGALTKSVIGEFPVIGPQLHSNVHQPLRGSPLAILFGVVTLAWGALGVSQILQQTLYDVWGVPSGDRPNFVSRVLRGAVLFLLLGLGIVGTTVVASVGSVLNWGPFGSLLAALPAALVNIGVFLAVFRLLSPPDSELRSLLPGAIVGGVGWQVLQSIGVNLVSHQLRHSSQVYGVFAVTLGLLSFLYLAAELTVYSAEINVVRARHLWPRSLLEKAGDQASPASAAGGPGQAEAAGATGRPGREPGGQKVPGAAGRPERGGGQTTPEPETTRPPAPAWAGSGDGAAAEGPSGPRPADGPRPPSGKRWQAARSIR